MDLESVNLSIQEKGRLNKNHMVELRWNETSNFSSRMLIPYKNRQSVYKEEGDHREIWRGIKFSQVKASKWLGKASGKVGGGAKDESSKEGMKPETT